MNKNPLINKNYDDCYFSEDNGYLESQYVFIDGNNLQERLVNIINIGETGFGTGLNLLVLEDFLLSNNRDLTVSFTTVEKYLLEPIVVREALLKLKEVSESSLTRHIELYKKIFGRIKTGWNVIVVKREWGELTINLFYGDVLESFKNYPTVIDAWFLDGHSPDKNPEMWNSSIFNAVAFNSKKGTTFSTFTAAGVVKRGLREAGFYVKRKRGFGQKRHMILGTI